MSDMIGFLHCHPGMEANHNVDRAHVIVDREDWEKLRNSQENIESPDSAAGIPKVSLPSGEHNTTKATICSHYGKEIVNRYTGESEIIHHCRSEGKL